MADLNEDGMIDSPADYVGQKEASQTCYGGIGNTIRYKNIELDFFFQFVKQTGYSYAQSFITPGYLSNQPSLVMHTEKHLNVQLKLIDQIKGSIARKFFRRQNWKNNSTASVYKHFPHRRFSGLFYFW